MPWPVGGKVTHLTISRHPWLLGQIACLFLFLAADSRRAALGNTACIELESVVAWEGGHLPFHRASSASAPLALPGGQGSGGGGGKEKGVVCAVSPRRRVPHASPHLRYRSREELDWDWGAEGKMSRFAVKVQAARGLFDSSMVVTRGWIHVRLRPPSTEASAESLCHLITVCTACLQILVHS